MGRCIAVKLEGTSDERWAVMACNSDSMFGPTFIEQLAAMMFAEVYTQMDWRQPDKWSDNAQDLIAREIKSFIDEKMPEGERNRRLVPAEWVKAIVDAGADEDDEPAHLEVKRRMYDFEQIVEDASEQWKRGRVKVLDMLIEWFHKWQAERAQAAKGPAPTPKAAKAALVPVKDALPGGSHDGK